MGDPILIFLLFRFFSLSHPLLSPSSCLLYNVISEKARRLRDMQVIVPNHRHLPVRRPRLLRGATGRQNDRLPSSAGRVTDGEADGGVSWSLSPVQADGEPLTLGCLSLARLSRVAASLCVFFHLSCSSLLYLSFLPQIHIRNRYKFVKSIFEVPPQGQ